MIGERVHFHVGPVLLKRQPSGVYQMLDLVFKGQAFFGGDEGWQEVFVRHWDRGEFLSWPRGKVPYRVGTDAKVGIAGRASRGWSQSLGAP